MSASSLSCFVESSCDDALCLVFGLREMVVEVVEYTGYDLVATTVVTVSRRRFDVMMMLMLMM